MNVNNWYFRSINGPFLVIGPKSTLRNWYNEVNRFCPSLRALTLIGEKTARQEVIHQLEDRRSWDVLLTTYEMILAEKSALKRYNWRYLVVDEAHRLKNENNKISTILRSFKSDNRLLLTGTPLQVRIQFYFPFLSTNKSTIRDIDCRLFLDENHQFLHMNITGFFIPLCRTIYMNCGLYWISYCPRCLSVQKTLINGSIQMTV